MKNYFYLLCCIVLVLTSCSKVENPPIASKVYMVPINVQAEVSTTYPQTKSSTTDDIYGIEIYNKSLAVSNASYTPYAYGYFDDPSKILIKMYDNIQYKISLTYIKNGKNILAKDKDGKYSDPLEIDDSRKASIDNTLIYQPIEFRAYDCSTYIVPGKYYSRPPLDRFYGESPDFIPSDTNKTLSIPTKRVGYAINFITDGLIDGNIKITLSNSPDIIINANDNNSTTPPQQEVILCSSNILNAYNFNETNDSCYTEDIDITVTWNRASGDSYPIYTGKISAKRNKIAIVTIKIKDPTIYGGVSIIGLNEQFQNGDSYTIGNQK